YSLLSDSEQVLFRQLGVFSGGFSLEGAEAVCGGDGVSEVLAGVVSLVDKSLVKTQEMGGRVRFGMLETVREYAVERLEESGEARLLGQKHLAFFLALAETAEPEFLGPEQGEWFDRVEADLANVYRALDWGIAAGEMEQGLGLASSLRDFWLSRNHYREGQAWLERLLKLSGSQESLNRAKAVSTAALIAQWTGDWVTAHRLGEEGITLWRILDDKRGLAESLNVVGVATWLLGDYTTCLPMFEEALQLCRDIGDSAHLDWALGGLSVALVIHGRFADATDLMAEALTLARSRGDQSMTAYCLSHTGHIYLQQSHYAEARALYQASAALCRELGDSWPLANNLLLLGYTSWAEGDYEDATALCQESLALWRGLGHKQRGANTLNVLGLIARALDKPIEADALYRESLDLFQVTSHRLGEAALRHNLGRLAEQHGELARAATLYRESLRLNHAQRDWRATAFCLAGLGRVADRLGDPQRAGRLFDASDGLLAAGGPLLIPDDRVEYDHDSPTTPQDREVERVWAEDQALTLEQAVAYALEAAPTVEQYRGG
ncbi:MAG: tetratricopeptide repeat protein, partial [Anaerolineae bacterium]|nr:tetratricopeptide repeat protein [Anaerolineae bacterium]